MEWEGQCRQAYNRPRFCYSFRSSLCEQWWSIFDHVWIMVSSWLTNSMFLSNQYVMSQINNYNVQNNSWTKMWSHYNSFKWFEFQKVSGFWCALINTMHLIFLWRRLVLCMKCCIILTCRFIALSRMLVEGIPIFPMCIQSCVSMDAIKLLQ